ncbi:peptidyl-tRNA hydrolase ICT1, mitochondrial [Syngnathoides biaculeatus]|uniref:peptidyl-tRNA hydrolase ICT1, mitochondrial n=1 Tax=Syngnathoides biaculeatus TaxID=300417 RepID=UPI002ADD9D64|nr:peptidyl-tRNA hydrolase ICT1, mitochondrial [Syngnathoides biaculeatus]
MAASMARRWFSICGNVRTCLNANSLPPKCPRVHLSELNSSLQQNAGYVTRRSDNGQDAQLYIPVDRLTVSYSRSSGPGGQHVNKVNTKTEIRFHVLTADWIPEVVRQKILEKNKNRINKAGELLVTSELSRSQHRNFTDCLQKISGIIAEASEKPHEAMPEEIALRKSRLDKRNKERIRQKKIHSATKQSRRLEFD